MLVWILNWFDLPDNKIKMLVEKLTRAKIIASAVFYTIMVFIVVFGISGDVYAGFPRLIPYVIIAVFLFMAFIRMYQCMVDDAYIKQVAAKKLDEGERKIREREQRAAKKKEAKAAGSGKMKKSAAKSVAAKESAASADVKETEEKTSSDSVSENPKENEIPEENDKNTGE